MDLFKPVVAEDKFHHNFLATIKPNATGVRQVLSGCAYVVAIANYGRQDFSFLGDVAMQRLLFDPENKKQVLKANGSAVPLGLFNADGYAHISAVMFSSVATFGKTRALGRHEGEFVF